MNIAEVVHMNHKLLVKLALAVAASETRERKFRTAVAVRVSQIEATAMHIHGAQIAGVCRKDRATDEQTYQFAKEIEERIVAASEQNGLKMIRYIYGESESQAERHDRRRRWWDGKFEKAYDVCATVLAA